MDKRLYELTQLVFTRDDEELDYLSSKIAAKEFEIRISETLSDDGNNTTIGYHVSVYADGLTEQYCNSIAPVFSKLVKIPGGYYYHNMGHIAYVKIKDAANCVKAIHDFIMRAPHNGSFN